MTENKYKQKHAREWFPNAVSAVRFVRSLKVVVSDERKIRVNAFHLSV